MDEEELGSARFEATAFMLNLAGVGALLAYAALTPWWTAQGCRMPTT
jgi:hypothetical protein